MTELQSNPSTSTGACDPYAAAQLAAERLGELTGQPRHDVAVVLGSGWRPAADLIGQTVAELATTDLPGFAAPTVAGHAGTIRSVTTPAPQGGDQPDRHTLVFLGRTHYYEGHGVDAVVHGVRTAVAAGCDTVVLTNGCGALRKGVKPGSAVLISDHINLTAASPLTGPRFVDLTDLYSKRLRKRCKEIAPDLDEGVYVQLPGPHYETPAEIRFLRSGGADLVGMSTALEAIAAREAGAEVLGLSLVTNLAAGIGKQPLNHEEVLRTGQDSAERMGHLLADLLGQLLHEAGQ